MQLLVLALLTILPSCALMPLYDPVYKGDAPASPGTAWDREPFVFRETAKEPYDVGDLSGDMPLSKLLDIALYNNPSTRSSWNAARSAAYAYYASLSYYYPVVSFAGALNAQENKGTSFANSASGIVSNPGAVPVPVTSSTKNFSDNLSNNLSLSYLLLDFGGRNATAELAYETLKAANWQHDLTMQQVLLSVLSAYTSYLGNKGLVEGYELNLKDAAVAVEAAEAMRRAGLSTLTDVLLAQSTLETTRTNLFQAIGAEKTSFSEILIAIGLPADTAIKVEQLPQMLPVVEVAGNISSLLELAKQKRPDIGIAIAAIKQQEAQLAISYSSSMPTITAFADWNQIRFISPKKPSGYNEVVSLELDFPLFQGFYYINQQRQLRASVEEALANLDVQVATISTQIVTAYYAFKSAESAIPSSIAAVEYSERAFRGFVVQYKSGTASILDMLTALTSLSNARAQMVLIRTQWASSLANLAFAVGILTDQSGNWRR